MTEGRRWAIAILVGFLVGFFAPTDEGFIKMVISVAAGVLAFLVAGLVKPKART